MYIKCDNGFISTIRRGIRHDEILEIHRNNGLSKPVWISGSLARWWSFCRTLVFLGIAKER